jgi:hypothetical protein
LEYLWEVQVYSIVELMSIIEIEPLVGPTRKIMQQSHIHGMNSSHMVWIFMPNDRNLVWLFGVSFQRTYLLHSLLRLDENWLGVMATSHYHPWW